MKRSAPNEAPPVPTAKKHKMPEDEALLQNGCLIHVKSLHDFASLTLRGHCRAFTSPRSTREVRWLMYVVGNVCLRPILWICRCAWLSRGRQVGDEYDKLKKGESLLKFGGGFYCGKVQDIYVINGFYARMREQFTTPGTSIHYYQVEWDAGRLSWADFRGKVLGGTDPKTAWPTSLRNAVFRGWQGASRDPKETPASAVFSHDAATSVSVNAVAFTNLGSPARGR